jgi:hypothetical protein
MNNHTPDSNPVQLDLFPDTIDLPLSQGYVATIDAIDADLALFKWSAEPRKRGIVYVCRGVTVGVGRRKTIMLHREILGRILGRTPSRFEMADHIDGNGLNNRRGNIRLATRAQNNANARLASHNKSGYKGVSYYRPSGKWMACIRADGKTKYLGYYDTPEAAHEAYKAAALEVFGSYANDGEKPLK